MEENREQLTIEDLAERGGAPIRTIRYYITEGLLPGPDGRGRATAYGEVHLLRLRLIRQLTEQHVPLKTIRDRLSSLGDDEIRALHSEEESREAALHYDRVPRSPRQYLSTLLERARFSRELKETSSHALFSAPLDSAMPAPTQPPTPDEESQAWSRWVVAPGIEIHVQSEIESANPALVRRIVDAARTQVRRNRP